MMAQRRIGINAKLRLMFIVLSVSLVSIMAVAYALLEIQENKEELSSENARVAAMIATSGRAAVAFADEQFAQRLVDGAMTGADLDAAFIVDADRQVMVASTVTDMDIELVVEEHAAAGAKVDFDDEHMVAQHPVVLDNEVIGTVFVISDYSELQAEQIQLAYIVAGALLLALGAAYLMSLPLQYFVAAPITRLAEEMALLSDRKDYGRRMHIDQNDEVGDLYERFNLMLDEIEARDKHIDGERLRLEQEVAQRTAELKVSNEQLEERLIELRAANEAALAAANSKAEFLANMSHEIRTPMNGVLGMLDLVRGTALTSEQRDLVEIAHHSGNGLLLLINDILDLSKIEAGKMSFEVRATAPAHLVEEVMSILQQQARTKQIELGAVMTAACYHGHGLDPGRLRQILLNLVGNAIKFTEQGSVLVEAAVQERNGQMRLEVSVQDTGIGITEEAQARLFDAFTQADGSTTRRYGGTGLGLTITRQLIEMMQGSIDCSSVYGEGSVFRFELPLHSVQPQDQADFGLPSVSSQRVAVALPGMPLNERVLLHLLKLLGQTMVNEPAEAEVVFTDDYAYLHSAGARAIYVGARAGADASQIVSPPLRLQQVAHGLSGELKTSAVACPLEELPQYHHCRVLLAEDNSVNQLVAKKMLDRYGVEYDVADNGLEALECLQSQTFQLILMDCQMPQMDGYHATREIRNREREGKLPRVPIVALTANAMEGDADKCLEAGMDDYLSKPVDLERLGVVLERWLDVAVTGRSPR